MFCADCPYSKCWECESRELEVDNWDTQIVECPYCDKEYWCKISFNYV